MSSSFQVCWFCIRWSLLDFNISLELWEGEVLRHKTNQNIYCKYKYWFCNFDADLNVCLSLRVTCLKSGLYVFDNLFFVFKKFIVTRYGLWWRWRIRIINICADGKHPKIFMFSDCRDIFLRNTSRLFDLLSVVSRPQKSHKQKLSDSQPSDWRETESKQSKYIMKHRQIMWK